MILNAVIEDAQELEGLINSAYRGDEAKKGWTTEADFIGGIRADKQHVEELIAKSDAQLLKYINEDKKIVGCVFLEKQDGCLYLGMLCVSPTLQGGGVGKKLLYKGEEVAKELGLDKVRMTVFSNRVELIDWYERHGYVKTGETKPFDTGGPGIFGDPKFDLTFLILEKKIV
jgi:ribosomal protein S18 acetylase RimI-like enzyme